MNKTKIQIFRLSYYAYKHVVPNLDEPQIQS